MKDTNIYTENSIRTYTGKVFDLKIMDPDSICIEDIAHALSNTARFGGHLNRLYSVAQHSCYVAINSSKENMLAALLHDASEAYIGDMPSPFKSMMPDYQEIENRLMAVIAKKFGFQFPLVEEIHREDQNMFQVEWRELVLGDNPESYQSPERAEKLFLDMFYQIMENQKVNESASNTP